ncbi:MAG: DUF72 domain-containing protein [Solirubrobacterales bacterium]
MKPLRVGCSGWSYESWRGRFYPQKLSPGRWLEAYAESFDTVEVNATFYRLQKRPAVERWVEATPPGFLFAVKASRYMTHIRRLQSLAEPLRRFWEPLAPLREAGKLGPVLWQLPESFHRDDDRLEATLDRIADDGGQHCFEFRHPSWFAPPVLRLLRERGASLVIADDRRRPLPVAKPTGPLVYVRFHYGARGRRGNYSVAELATWRRRLAAWRSRRPVFAYFNNDWEGFAPANARELVGAG